MPAAAAGGVVSAPQIMVLLMSSRNPEAIKILKRLASLLKCFTCELNTAVITQPDSSPLQRNDLYCLKRKFPAGQGSSHKWGSGTPFASASSAWFSPVPYNKKLQ